MEILLGGIGGLIILGIFLPQLITTFVMAHKGYSGCLWFFLSFFLSWIGVIIALCMPNVRRQEERHKETIAALSSQKSDVVVINNSEKKDETSQSSSFKNLRLEAIKNLKAMDKSFDDYDVELEVERLEEQYNKQLAQEIAKQKQRQLEASLGYRIGMGFKQNKVIALACLAVIVVIILSVILIDRARDRSSKRTTTAEQGVVINGVRWATRNVDAPGTFAASPESPGMFFQWNRRQGWSATIGNASGWDDSMPTGTAWTSANNPCPPGWRLPTAAEFQSLDNAGSRWTTQNGVSGRLFGSGTHQLFLPTAGWRVSSSGALNGVGSGGVYWSSTLCQNENTHAMRFGIYQSYTNLEARNHAHGFSVRCVEDVAASISQQEAPQDISTSLDGVIINSVRWATRNVDAPGTFAATPESVGMFFQWNRRRGWAGTGNVTGWDSSDPASTSWRTANDPCPQGWRVPTANELYSLWRAGSIWITRNGVDGRLFGNAPNQIFLPAAGFRESNGAISTFGIGSGYYWSNDGGEGLLDDWGSDFVASFLILDRYSAHIGMTTETIFPQRFGLSVRCVAE